MLVADATEEAAAAIETLVAFRKALADSEQIQEELRKQVRALEVRVFQLQYPDLYARLMQDPLLRTLVP